MNEPTARLENWCFFGKFLLGQVYEDKKQRWKDGHTIKSSRIVTPSAQGLREGMIVKTFYDSYLLGKEALE